MIKRIFIAYIAAILTFTVSQAKELFPDSETAKNDVELGVKGIARLCPTGLWEHWTFRDIVYDRDSNTIALLKPDYANLVAKDIPMVLTSEQFKHLINN